MSLKVFDLQCDVGHVFEGWFASTDDYARQHSQGLLACPMCDSREISKMLSAPRLNIGRGESPTPESASASAGGSAGKPAASVQLAQIQAQVLAHVRDLVRKSEDVGDRFAEEARRMHQGEIEHRPIRGATTIQEREELASEGIAVMPIPDFLDDDRLQ